MRGSPIVRLLILLIAMGLLLIPLWRLTGSRLRETEPSHAVRDASTRESEVVSLEFTTAGGPAYLEVTHLGDIVWQGKVEKTKTCTLTIHFPREGIELGVLGEFDGGNHPGALRITVTPADGIPMEKTIWSDGPIDEILVFERQ